MGFRVSLSNITKFTPSFWAKLVGSRKGIIGQIKNRVQKKHKNYKDQLFARYSADYAKAKSSGDKKLLGIEGQNQASTSIKPDMTLTGLMMQGLQVFNISKIGASFGC